MVWCRCQADSGALVTSFDLMICWWVKCWESFFGLKTHAMGWAWMVHIQSKAQKSMHNACLLGGGGGGGGRRWHDLCVSSKNESGGRARVKRKLAGNGSAGRWWRRRRQRVVVGEKTSAMLNGGRYTHFKRPLRSKHGPPLIMFGNGAGNAMRNWVSEGAKVRCDVTTWASLAAAR